tara:strand:+ start:2103 stop:2288 length:186 start_codon:yes stop_codon:yes gene_type:complete
MKNRTYINKQLDNLEGTLSALRGIVSKQEPLETYLKGLEKAEALIDEIRSQIENEPITSHE